MGVIDHTTCPVKTGSIYPSPYKEMMAGRSSLRLGDAGGLTQFGANLVILQSGAVSSLRHWHQNEDEFVMGVQGICTLVQDEGATDLHPGDCAAFKAGDPNGHHFQNRESDSDQPVQGRHNGPCFRHLISDPGALTQFGAFVEVLPPGPRSSFRQWKRMR